MSRIFAKSNDVFDLIWIVFVLGAGLIQMLAKFRSNKKKQPTQSPPAKAHAPPPLRHARRENPPPEPTINPEDQIRGFFEKLMGASVPQPVPLPVAPPSVPPTAPPAPRKQQVAPSAPENPTVVPATSSHAPRKATRRATVPRGFRMKLGRVKIRPTQISHNLSGKPASALRPDWSSRDALRRQMVGHLILGKPRALD